METNQVGFFDFEVFRQDWLVVILTNKGQRIIIHNDKEALKKVLTYFICLIGFNNYHYDDLILAGIISRNLSPMEVYELSNQIISGKRDYMLENIAKQLPTLDTMQELQIGLSLKEIESNLGMNIKETPIDFNIPRRLTKQEIQEVIQYCEHDVRTTIKVYELRQDYFESKMDICQEFVLEKKDVRETRANLAAKVLKCHQGRLPKGVKNNKDRLQFKLVDNLRTRNIPEEILKFYQNIKLRFEAGESFETLEKEKLKYTLYGVPHVYAFGGLHGAIPNFYYEGPMLSVDVGSYYPSMMINFDFISRGSEHPDYYKNLYKTRMKYKKEKNPKQGIYKILLNATFGAMKFKSSHLYDPVQNNNICINGQLILTDLLTCLQPYSKIIQSNTDGILIAYQEKDLPQILNICKEWERNYGLNLDYEYASKIAQRDVNNYCILLNMSNSDGTSEYKIKGKGQFANGNGGNFEKNNLTIIDMALTAYYMEDVTPGKFVMDLIRKNNIMPFQQVAKMGGTFDKMIHEYQGVPYEVQKVNRIFATWKKDYGSIHKVKIENEIERFHKIANSSDRVYIHNDSIETLDKSILDLPYYVKLIEKNIFTKKKVTPWELFQEK